MTTILESLMIREYLWNAGDGDGIIDGFYDFIESNDMEENSDDYWYVVELIDRYVSQELIDEFLSFDDPSLHIDEYEIKIEKIISKKFGR